MTFQLPDQSTDQLIDRLYSIFHSAKVSSLDDPDGGPQFEDEQAQEHAPLAKRPRVEASELSTGIPELDARGDEPFATIGNLLLYIRPSAITVEKPASKVLNDVLPMLQVVENINRAQNFVLHYKDGPLAVEGVFDSLALVYYDFGLCVGKVDDGIVAYIKRNTYHKFNPEVTAPDGTVITPTCYQFKRGGRPQVTVSAINDLMANPKTNIEFKQGQEFQIYQVLNGIKNMTDTDVLKLKATFELKSPESRTPFEKAYLRCHATIMRVRELKGKDKHTLMFSANDIPPGVRVAPLSDFINLDQVGHSVEEVSMATKKWMLSDLFTKAEVMGTHGVILLGNDQTTGFGKTNLALRLALQWSRAMAKSAGRSESSAKIVFSTDIDSARDIVFARGMVWVIDEFHPWDREQVQYMSEGMLKVLVVPTAQGCVRARNESVKLVPGVGRIFTGNSSSGQDWCGRRLKWSLPLQRKAIIFQITKPLISDAGRQRLHTSQIEDSSNAAASEMMAKEFFDAHPPTQENPRGIFGCPHRM